MTLNDLELPKIGGFSKIFRDFGLQHAFQKWIAPEWLQIDQNNLRMKFSALNVDFSNFSLDPLGSRRLVHVGVK